MFLCKVNTSSRAQSPCKNKEIVLFCKDKILNKVCIERNIIVIESPYQELKVFLHGNR